MSTSTGKSVSKIASAREHTRSRCGVEYVCAVSTTSTASKSRTKMGRSSPQLLAMPPPPLPYLHTAVAQDKIAQCRTEQYYRTLLHTTLTNLPTACTITKVTAVCYDMRARSLCVVCARITYKIIWPSAVFYHDRIQIAENTLCEREENRVAERERERDWANSLETRPENEQKTEKNVRRKKIDEER